VHKPLPSQEKPLPSQEKPGFSQEKPLPSAAQSSSLPDLPLVIMYLITKYLPMVLTFQKAYLL
jgi:hypothetical protein